MNNIHCNDFPSARIKPNERVNDMPFEPVAEKRKVPGLSIDVSVDTDNLSVKLRTIAKHATALADELDEIDQREGLDGRVQD